MTRTSSKLRWTARTLGLVGTLAAAGAVGACSQRPTAPNPKEPLPAERSGPTGAPDGSTSLPRGEGSSLERRYSKPAEPELRRSLSAEAYRITQQDGTEPPFQNAFWDEHREGLYVDVASGEPLFTSMDKFDSGTGWPSFTRPIASARVAEHTDSSWGMVRVEVRSRDGDSHLGHVFEDGPAPTGRRYCINSAALRFIPVERLAEEGYGDLLPLFGRPAP